MSLRSRARERWLPHLPRAIVTSLVVGTALVLINHGDQLRRAPIAPHFWLKCGLSYAVPFLVSLVSAGAGG